MMNWMRAARVAAGISLLSVLVLSSGPAKSDDKSAAVYKQKCAACHGPDGKGDTPAGKSTKVRSFADPEVANRDLP